jgi:uncharacterized protein YkwD
MPVPPTGLASHSEEQLLRARNTVLVVCVLTISTLLSIAAAPGYAVSSETYELQAVQATNVERESANLHTLRPHRCLTRFAERQASRMAAQQRIFHQDLNQVRRRCHLAGVGENVASGFLDGGTMVSVGWMGSPNHRRNLLTRPFRFVAVAAAQSDSGRWYSSQVLGTR